MTVTVELTQYEMALAEFVARQQHKQNLERGAQPRYGGPTVEDGFEIRVVGNMAEMAGAKYLNLYWSGNVGNYDAIDVGGLVEVRSANKSHHKLRLHPDDKDCPPFVLAIAAPPFFTLVGWIYGYAGKLPQYWQTKTGRPCFFVPQDKLWPIEQLKERHNDFSHSAPERGEAADRLIL